MKTLTKSIALCATLLAGAAQVSAMQEETMMLTGALYSQLNAMQLDVAMMTNLTLAEINNIALIAHGGDTESEKKAKIDTILRKAAAR